MKRLARFRRGSEPRTARFAARFGHRTPLAAAATFGTAVFCVVALAGCGNGSGQVDQGLTVDASGQPRSLQVFAAASLTDSFTALADRFEAANPGVEVRMSFAGSSALARQIRDGAPADVYASANASTMTDVVTAGLASPPVTFATNSMAIAVAPDNPGQVTSLQDLAKDSVTVALCQPQVPCGVTAAAVFAKAGLAVAPVTLEPDVRAVLSKVTLGEVDAGLVYVTDISAAGDRISGVGIPTELNATTAYPIAALTNSGEPATAVAFVDFVLSESGQKVLAEAGFGPP